MTLYFFFYISSFVICVYNLRSLISCKIGRFANFENLYQTIALSFNVSKNLGVKLKRRDKKKIIVANT